jgi:TetR/AcrR family transcriptional regulator, tetracycline repressor protein
MPGGNAAGTSQDLTDGAGAGERLSREGIVHAAIALIDQYGVQGLTMRGLGQRLGVEAMALYRYVTGREDLLEAVIAELLAGLREDLDDGLTDSWQGYLQALAHRVRRIAVEHPGIFPLVATRHPAAPWLRPPLRSLELVEDFLDTLAGHGLSDEQVVGIYRAFTSFLLGNLLLEAAQRGAETSPIEEPLDEGGAQIANEDGQLDLTGQPTIVRCRALLSEDRSAEEFEIALETLLDRLELDLSQ